MAASSTSRRLLINRRSPSIYWLVFALVIQQADQAQAEYEPFNTSLNVEIIDTRFAYGATNRSVPLRLYLPEIDSPAPVIRFSHGLGGSREASPFLGKQWSQPGYCVVFMQHTGSDRDVMKNAPVTTSPSLEKYNQPQKCQRPEQ